MEEIKKEEKTTEELSAEEIAAMKGEIERVVKEFLSWLGVRGKVDIKDQEGGFYVNCRMKAMAGFLIGKKGNTIRAMECLVKEMVRKKYPNLPPLLLDISGYRMRRVHFLQKKALAIARVVMETKREMAFDFLTPRELKIVADALANTKEVKIWTIGSGPKVQVVIAPNP